MKRHFSQPSEPMFRLSIEEEAILADEQNEGLAEIAAGESEIDRAMETNEVLDSATATVQEIETPGPVETELMAAVADMAVAGTDADPDNLITTGEGVSTEDMAAGIMDKLAKLWKHVKEMLMKAFNYIKSFFVGREKAIESAVSAQDENDKFLEENKTFLLGHDASQDADAKAEAADAKAVQDKAAKTKAMSELHDTLQHHNFKFKGDTSLISTTAGVPKDFEKQLGDFLQYSQNSHKEIGKILREICYGFDEVMGQFESAKPEAAIPPYCDKFTRSFEVLMRSVGDLKNMDDQRVGRTKVGMIGGFVIEAVDFSGDVTKAAGQLKALARSKIEIKVGSPSKPAEVPLINDTAQQSFGVGIKRWLDFANGSDVKSLESTLNDYNEKFVNHLDRLVNVHHSVKSADALSDASTLLQAMIDLCRSLVKMVTEFTTKHIRCGLQIVRTAQAYQKESNAERLRMVHAASA